MPKTSEQKRKILELCRIFEERTDDEHGMTAAELIGALDECGVSAERKSLYGDIDALRDFGMDIVSVREGQRTEYRLVSRTVLSLFVIAETGSVSAPPHENASPKTSPASAAEMSERFPQ